MQQQQLSVLPDHHSGRISKMNSVPFVSSRPVALPHNAGAPGLNEGEFCTDYFRMYKLKVFPCFASYVHDWTQCPNYHPGENARRRDPGTHNYSPLQCPNYRLGHCIKGDACEFAHGLFETWLHPAQYRTKPCRDGDQCCRKVCFFAHNAQELRPIYKKTGCADRQCPSRLSSTATPYSHKHDGFNVASPETSSYETSNIKKPCRWQQTPVNTASTVEVSAPPGPAMLPAIAGTMSRLHPESQRFQPHSFNAALNPNGRSESGLLAGTERSFPQTSLFSHNSAANNYFAPPDSYNYFS